MSKLSGIFSNSIKKAYKDLDVGKKVSVDINESKLSDVFKKAFDRAKKEEQKEEQKGDQIDTSISSTAIDRIKYDPDTEGLNVKFTSGSKSYFYPAVPLELIQAFLKASSKGKFFMANIHDQYSMYGKDHSKKDKKQQKGIKTYMKSYYKNNKGKWTK